MVISNNDLKYWNKDWDEEWKESVKSFNNMRADLGPNFNSFVQEQKKEFAKTKIAKEQQRQISPEELKVNYGVNIEKVEGDGNCFYYSVLDQLQNNGITHFRDGSSKEPKELSAGNLRKIAVAHIEANKDLYRDSIAPDSDNPHDKGKSSKSIEEYLQDQAKDKYYADDVVKTAIARELGVNIVVVSSNPLNPAVIQKTGENRPSLYMIHDGNHYDSLIPIKDNDRFKELENTVKSSEIDNVKPKASSIELISTEQITDHIRSSLESNPLEENKEKLSKEQLQIVSKINSDKLTFSRDKNKAQEVINEIADLSGFQIKSDEFMNERVVKTFQGNLGDGQDPKIMVSKLSAEFKQIQEDEKMAKNLDAQFKIAYGIDNNRSNLSKDQKKAQEVIKEIAQLAKFEITPEIRDRYTEIFQKGLKDNNQDSEKIVSNLFEKFVDIKNGKDDFKEGTKGHNLLQKVNKGGGRG